MSDDLWTALAVQEPWVWCLLYAGKPVENRRRKDGKMPAICRHRGPLIIHASAGMKRAEHRLAARMINAATGLYVPGPTWAPSVVSASVRQLGEHVPDRLALGGLRGVMNAVGHVEPGGRIVDYRGPALDMRWYDERQFALILVDPLPFAVGNIPRIVPWKGSLGPMKVRADDLPEHARDTIHAYAAKHAA